VPIFGTLNHQIRLEMKKALFIFCFTVAITRSTAILAQPGAPAGGDPPCGEPFGPPCPIDGVSLLVAAGVALGGKKAYDLRKGKVQE
jgi:hypothetical protein